MRLSRWFSTALLVTGVVLVGWTWFAGNASRNAATEAASSLLRPDDARLVSLGREIYAKACASCHGADLQGQAGWRTNRKLAPPHDETGHTWHHPDRLLFQVVKEGSIAMGGSMPGFRGMLTDEEIVAVLSWIKSRWPARVRQAHDAIDARASQG